MNTAIYKKICLAALVCLSLSACKSSEDRAAEHYENGLKLIEAGDPQRALVEFRNTVNLMADNIDARRKMAEIEMGIGRYQAAYRSYLQVVERVPDDLEGRITLSQLAFEARNWDEFERHGAAALKLAPEHVSVKAIDLGLNYRKAVIDKNDSERSVILAQAEALAENLPDSAILRQVRIDAYIAEQNYRPALELIEESIAITPNVPSLYNRKVQLLAVLGEKEALEAELRNMIEIFPEDLSPKQTLLRYLISQERIAEAESLLQRFFTDATTPETRNQAFLGLVQFIRSTRGIDAAVAKIEDSLKEYPDNNAWKVLLASLMFDRGERAKGVADIEALLSAEESTLSPTERQNTKITFATMLATTGNEVGARRQVAEILEVDPNAAPALKMQAVWLIEDDNTADAITALRAVLEQTPEDAAAMILMAQAYERAGDRALTISFLSRAVEASNNAPEYALLYARALLADKKLLQAESTLIASLRITPNNVEILQLLGRVYLALEDTPRTQKVAETLGKIDLPQAKNAANNLNAEIVAQQAGSDQALNFLEKLANEEGSGEVIAKLNLIQAQLRTGNVEEALEFAKKSVAEAPDNIGLRVALAAAYTVSRDFVSADSEFTNILEQRPDITDIWLRLARIKAAQGDREAAHRTIDEGLEAVPGAPNLLWGKASYLEAEGDIDGAISIYESLYETLSESPIVANNLASLLSTYKNDDASLARARTIARRLKGSEIPAFQDTYGWIQYRAGNIDEALPYLESAAESMGEYPMVLYHLGKTYAAAGRIEDAQKQFNQALAKIGTLGDQELAATLRSEVDALREKSDN